jgi:F-type H+-transporting ATPase subunit b
VLIDWFTVGAQLLNFIILVVLMKRFLYQPVLDAIATREQKIAAELADAAVAQTEAHQQRDEFRQKNATFDEQRADLLRQATEEAGAERERLQREAREAAERAGASRAKALQAEARHLHADIARQAQQQVFDISRRVLHDLAAVSLEQRACEVFIERLHGAERETLAALGAALKTASADDPAVLRSAFDRPAAQRDALQTALDAAFGQAIALRFETTPELVSGIELVGQGQKLAWNVAGYLEALSTGLDAQLHASERA